MSKDVEPRSNPLYSKVFVEGSCAASASVTINNQANPSTKKQEDSCLLSSSYFQSYYSSMLGCQSEITKRSPRRISAEPTDKTSFWKCNAPTFKYKTDTEMDKQENEDEKPSSESKEASENGKRPKEEEDDDEWIQSPFGGMRFRKKDVDALVELADKYITADCKAYEKRRKVE